MLVYKIGFVLQVIWYRESNKNKKDIICFSLRNNVYVLYYKRRENFVYGSLYYFGF